MTEATTIKDIVNAYSEGKKRRDEEDAIMLAQMLVLIKEKSLKAAKKGLNSFVISKYCGGQNPLPGETYHQHAKCTEIFRRFKLLDEVGNKHGFTVQVITRFLVVDDKFLVSNVPTHYQEHEENELKGVYLQINFVNYDASTMSEEPCCICMEDYKCGDILSKCNQCKKYFHKICWIKSHGHKCPLCRAHCTVSRVPF
jgi:hypothetical protein